jgi:2-phosphosulfolactate phosphatase
LVERAPEKREVTGSTPVPTTTDPTIDRTITTKVDTVVEAVPGGAFGQFEGDVRFEWGPVGAAAVAGGAACLVVVDVLSFTTSVTITVGRGMTVFPYRWADPTAQDFATSHDAELAVRRRDLSPRHPWSLSPAVLSTAPLTPRLVLPSPNGSTIAAAAGATAAGDGGASGATVVAACLRNAAAVARWLHAQGHGTPGHPVAVVASGERWPDGSLRPALEDALGAGAVLHHLRGAGCRLSVEAEAAAALYAGTPDVEAAVRACRSARHLVNAGYGADVEVAARLDCDHCVPVMHEGAFSAPS